MFKKILISKITILFFFTAFIKCLEVKETTEFAHDLFPGKTFTQANAHKFADLPVANFDQDLKKFVGKVQESKFKPDKKFNEFIARFMTFYQFMDISLCDPNIGYYQTGTVRIGSEIGQVDFTTCVERMSPNFGRMIAYQGFNVWRSMIASGDIKPQEPYYMIEFGAGNGLLAFDALSWIEENAAKDKEWEQFYKVLIYVIGEKSAALIKRQREKNERFIKANKLEIREFDVTSNLKLFDSPVNGFVVSNELPDAFPVHKLKKAANGEPYVCVCVPIVDKACFSILNDQEQKKIKEQHSQNRKLARYVTQTDKFSGDLYPKTACNITDFNKNMHDDVGKTDYFVISRELWLQIKYRLQATNNIKLIEQFDNNVFFQEFYINHEYFPELSGYLARNLEVIRFLDNVFVKDEDDYQCRSGTLGIKFPEQKNFYANINVEKYVNMISQNLQRGFVMTIDYGNNWCTHFFEVEQPSMALRYYPRQATLAIPYLQKRQTYGRPGRVDLTTDVNFTDMAICGNNVGWRVVNFCPQNNLEGCAICIRPDTIAIPFDIKNPNFANQIEEQFQNPHFFRFKMLLQAVNTKSCYKILAPSLELFPNLQEKITSFSALEVAVNLWLNSAEDLSASTSVKMVQKMRPMTAAEREIINSMVFNSQRQLSPAIVDLLGRAKPIAEQAQDKCAWPVCKNKGTKICSGCRLVKYCSGECQKKHWVLHKPICQAGSAKKS